MSVFIEVCVGLVMNVRVDVDYLSFYMEFLVYVCLVLMVLNIFVVVFFIVNISYNLSYKKKKILVIILVGLLLWKI